MDLRVIKDSLNGMTIAQLERELGFSNGSISKWDRQSPSVDKVTKLADYFGISVDTLVGREHAPPHITHAELKLLMKLRELPPSKRMAIEALLE